MYFIVTTSSVFLLKKVFHSKLCEGKIPHKVLWVNDSLEALQGKDSSQTAARGGFLSNCCEGRIPLKVLQGKDSSQTAARRGFLSNCCEGRIPLEVLWGEDSSQSAARGGFLSKCCEGRIPLKVLWGKDSSQTSVRESSKYQEQTLLHAMLQRQRLNYFHMLIGNEDKFW